MGSLPSKADWRFNEIEVTEPERLEVLENAPPPGKLLEDLERLFQESLNLNQVRFGWEQACKNPEDFRIVIQFQVNHKFFDCFFNARTGYRAHFWAGINIGLNFNSKIISALRERLSLIMLDQIIAQKLDCNFQNLDEIDLAKSLVIQSLDDSLAKIWVCPVLIRKNDAPLILPIGITGPKLEVSRDKPWPGIYKDTDTWLEVKGAFSGSSRPYQPKAPDIRAKQLHIEGMT